MILTRCTLDRQNPSIRQCLRDRNDMHRSIMKLFGSARSDAGVLYRIQEEGPLIHVYLYSQQKPLEGGVLPMGFVVDGMKDLAPLEDSFASKVGFSFNLLAFPFVCKPIEGKNGKRMALKTPEERHSWMERKAEQNGFSILSLQEDRQVHIDVQGKAFSFDATEFSGVLEIVDPILFRKCFETGIGPEKSYGLGMILLKKVG